MTRYHSYMEERMAQLSEMIERKKAKEDDNMTTYKRDAVYRAEQRHARKGERIVIVEPNVHDSENYERGDIFIVDKVDSAGVVTTTGNIVYHEEYEVLPEEMATLHPIADLGESAVDVAENTKRLSELLASFEDNDGDNANLDSVEKPAQIRAACDELRDLLIRKNHDYGDSFAKQYEKYGLMSALIRMDDKMRRLETLVDGQQAQVAESIEDTLADLAGYALLALVEAKAQRS